LPKAEAVGQGASTADIHRIIRDLQGSSKPFLIVGGGGWDAEARVALGNFAEAMQVPVGTSFRCQDYIDNRHPNYAGDVGIAISPTLAARIRAADQLVVLGARLGEMTTGGYTLIDAPMPTQRLTHVHSDPDELGRVYWPAHAIGAKSSTVIKQLASTAKAISQVGRAVDIEALRNAFIDWKQPVTTPGPVQMERIGASILHVPGLAHAACADVRIDGIRASGGRCRKAEASGSRRGLLCGRRVLSDGFPRVWDRMPVLCERHYPYS
jgi:acetolactate synthase-1/2/3 large subunit